MENKIIQTAEDILESIQLENGAMFSSYISPHGNIAEIVNKAMIEFAKLHVEAALKEASDNVDYETDGQEHITDVWIDKDSILNSYSLDNIK